MKVLGVYFKTNKVCLPLPSNSSRSDDGTDFVCAENYFKSDGQCLKCGYQTTSEEGSDECRACEALSPKKITENSVTEYKYYDYTQPGCSTILTGI